MQESLNFGSVFPEYRQFTCVRSFSNFVLNVFGEKASGQCATQATIKAEQEGRSFHWHDVLTKIENVRKVGLTVYIKSMQSDLIKRRMVLTQSQIGKYFDDNEADNKRLLALSQGCSQTPHGEFIPNNGEKVIERRIGYFPMMSQTIMIHLADEHRKGLSVVISLNEARVMCENENLTLHVSEMFMREKQDAPLGRPIPDYSFNRYGPPMASEEHKMFLAKEWGTIQHQSIVDICKSMRAARTHANGRKVFGARTDLRTAFAKILINADEATLMAKLVTMNGPDGKGPMIAIPLVNQWGSQVAGYAFDVITRILRKRAQIRVEVVGLYVIMYVDDHLFFAVLQVVELEVREFMADARQLLGVEAVNEAKNVLGECIDAIGWRCDCRDWTVAPSARAIAKLVNLFFNELPQELTTDTKITVKSIMRMSSYAIRYALAILPMRPYTSSFAQNMRGSYHSVMDMRRLLARTIADIQMWRSVLSMMFNDASILKVPIEWPIAEASNGFDDDGVGADIVVYTDAQKTHGGMGVYIPNNVWMAAEITSHQYFVNEKSVEIDINIYEYIAVLLGMIVAIRALRIIHGDNGARLKRIHIFTDNSSCISWIRSRRSQSVTHAILMQLTTIIQLEYSFILTISHIPGVQNTVADAISRRFEVPDGHRIREQLSQIDRELAPIQLLTNFENALSMRNSTLFTVGLAVRTALVNVSGYVSRVDTLNH